MRPNGNLITALDCLGQGNVECVLTSVDILRVLPVFPNGSHTNLCFDQTEGTIRLELHIQVVVVGPDTYLPYNRVLLAVLTKQVVALSFSRSLHHRWCLRKGASDADRDDR